MDSSKNVQAPPQAAYFLWYCDKVYIVSQTGSMLSSVFSRSDCQLTIKPLSIGLKMTMYSYKWIWLTVVELSITRHHKWLFNT